MHTKPASGTSIKTWEDNVSYVIVNTQAIPYWSHYNHIYRFIISKNLLHHIRIYQTRQHVKCYGILYFLLKLSGWFTCPRGWPDAHTILSKSTTWCLCVSNHCFIHWVLQSQINLFPDKFSFTFGDRLSTWRSKYSRDITCVANDMWKLCGIAW